MADDLRRVGLVFKEDGAVDFKKSLQEVNLELTKNYNQFKLTQAQWDKSTSSTKKLRAEQEYLQNAYEIQQDKVRTLKMQLSDLENAENKNTTAIKKKRNELNAAEIKLESYNKRIKDIENQLHNTGKKLEEFGAKIENTGNKIEGVGKKLSAFSAATAGALVASAKSAIDFEDAFTGVTKTVDGTEEQLEEIKQGIIEMSKELPSTTTEISAVAEAAGQLGIKTENILGFSKAMIDLGNSTNLTADEAATQLARFANIMQMSQSDFDRLGSAIVDLGNNFQTSEAEIVSMSMRLAGAGKQVGLSEGQVLGLATALSSVGIEAEMGGSAISKMMVNMQNAVEMGGTKLNTVLKKTGKSLRSLELMSANNSKDFKALAGSIGMTSTELNQLIKAGANLEDFAKISGMSAKDFQKAWKEDAAGALTAFIKGLGDAESKGESAITMLSEMGLTEVRLRDSLLRAANAGNLFNNAISTGTKAWEENTALTNEANKRYENLKSQIIMATNKIKALAISFGNKLMPEIKKGIEYIDKLAKRVEKLDDKQVKWILNIAKAVVAIGPLVTILGKVTSVTGTTIKAIGTFTQAIGVIRGTVTTTSTAVNGLVGVIGALTSPLGAALVATTALAAGLTLVTLKKSENQKQTKELAQAMADERKSFEEVNNAIEEQMNANLAQISNSQKLRNELSTLVDENGKVKEGYEARVSFILKELNKALGTEYSLNGNIVNSYKEIQEQIDKTIEKKKAQIILQSEEEKYTEAIKKQQEAVEKLKKVQEELGMSYEQAKKRYVELKNSKEADDNWTLGKERLDLENLIKAYDDAEYSVKTYTENVKKYEKDYALFSEKKYDEIYKSVTQTTEKMTDETTQKLKESITEQQQNLQDYQEQVKSTGNAIAQEYATQSEQNLNNLINELYERTSTVENLGQDEIEAWRQIASNSYEKYSEKMKEIPEETRRKIEEATGIITSDVDLKTEAGKLAGKVTVSFNENAKGEDAGKQFTRGIKIGLANSNEVKGATDASGSLGAKILNRFKEILGIHSPSKEAEEAAKYFLEGFIVGIEGNEKRALKSVKDLAGNINGEMDDNLSNTVNVGMKGNNNSKNQANYNRINDTIISNINNTNNKIVELLTKILEKEGQSIVLDTGQFVGATTNSYNVALANSKTREERGN